jgi:hypothetical protein
MNGLRTTGTWVLGGLALVLALASPQAWAQNWTSRSSAVITTSADDSADSSSNLSDAAPSSGWHPARPAGSPRPIAVSPFVEDETAKPIETAKSIESVSNSEPPPARAKLAAVRRPVVVEEASETPAPVFRDALQMRVGGEYVPAWQRTPHASKLATSVPGASSRRTAAQRVSHNAPTVAPPIDGGKTPAPFVEDEIVPSPQQREAVGGDPIVEAPMAAESVDGDVHFHDQDQIDGIDNCSQCGGPGPCNGLGMCGTCGGDPMACERFFVCGPWSFLNELSFFSGVQGFKGPVDQGTNGNFGASVGFNMGDAIWHRRGVGYQFGAQYLASDFNGSQADGFGAGSRTQVFATAGLFHRAYYNYGWQGGAVVDYLNDHYYYNATLFQIRAELSFVGTTGHEFGVSSTTRSRSPDLVIDGINQTLQPINILTGFYRWNTCNGSQLRLKLGASGPVQTGIGSPTESIVIGADYRMVLSNRIDFVGAFTFLQPTQSGIVAQQQEAYGMNMNLVFYPARYSRGTHAGPYRPLFNVADPTSFILGRLIP